MIDLWPLKQKWFWQLFLLLLLAILLPFIIFYALLLISPSSIVLAFVLAIFIWVIVRSYKRYIRERKRDSLESKGAT
ncbi:MAG: hypothetical protein QXV01_00885 [Candidatus Bathyarchaeia archaeon]